MTQLGEATAPRNATEIAVDLIRQAVLDGRLVPGARLKEEDLAAQLQISRTPIREALVILTAEGLIVAPRNRGARVRIFGPADLQHALRIRELLEGFAAERAAGRITEAQLSQLRENTERYQRVADLPRELKTLVAANDRFHQIILEAAGMPRITAMVNQMRSMPRDFETYMQVPRQRLAESGRQHGDILQALGDHDAARAGEIMRAHIAGAREALADDQPAPTPS